MKIIMENLALLSVIYKLLMKVKKLFKSQFICHIKYETHTHKNAFIICETEPVMESGDCGDL